MPPADRITLTGSQRRELQRLIRAGRTEQRTVIRARIVLAAADGATALVLLDGGEAADVIISDLSMPGMDGLTVIREAQRRRPRLPAILLTGFATNAAEIAVGGALSGAFTLLRKPVTGEHLAERIAVLLQGVAASS